MWKAIVDRLNHISFGRKQQVLLTIICALFTLLVSCGIHGFSFSIWRDIIDQTPQEEVLLGEPRNIRSDDFFAEIPLQIAQTKTGKFLPQENPLLPGDINTVANPIRLPAWHLSFLFKPSLWGYVFGPDAGIAWLWASLSLGLFVSCFLAFGTVTNGNFSLTFLASLAVVFSPFVQFWSFHLADIYAYAMLTFYFSHQFFCARTTRSLVLTMTALVWVSGCLILNIYPPYQVPAGYIALFLIIGKFLSDRFQKQPSGTVSRAKLLFLVVGVIVLLCVTLHWYFGNHETLQLIRNTVYPGKRVSQGGGYPMWRLFSNNFVPFTHIERWYLNICESSSWILMSPPILLYCAYSFLRRKTIDWIVLCLSLLTALFYTYAALGFSPTLASLSLLSFVPPGRMNGSFGLLDTTTVIACFCYLSTIKTRSISDQIVAIFLGVLWTGFLFGLGSDVHTHYPDIPEMRTVLWAIFYGIITVLVCAGSAKIRVGVLALIVATSVMTTSWFNPLSIGGYSYVSSNPLSKNMLAQAGKDDECQGWATYGQSLLINLPRMLGLPSINGTIPYPLFDMWSVIDPEGRYAKNYNRYAHVFYQPSSSIKAKISNPHPDQTNVTLNPDAPALRHLGVNFVLAVGAEEIAAFLQSKEFFQVYAQADRQIFKRKNPVICSDKKQDP